MEGRYPELLRAFRDEVGWSREEASRFVGVANRTWQAWESIDSQSGRSVPEPVLRLLALYRMVRRNGYEITGEEMDSLRAALPGGLPLRSPVRGAQGRGGEGPKRRPHESP